MCRIADFQTFQEHLVPNRNYLYLRTLYHFRLISLLSFLGRRIL
nr:MAG TPA: hypothetical protein [Siphoviridae sp. ctQHO9]